ncbi:MAG: hypothetical protein HKN23_08915 [Verrucomicrobiales bacterium]|nr:hypothetical protein [Verrucomicrobiales bacterium]
MDPHTPPTLPSPTPPVITWFKVYAGFMAFIYLAVMAMGGFLLVLDDPSMTEEDRLGMIVGGAVYLVLGLVFLVVFLIPFFLKPSPGAWVYDIVLICIGLTSVCLLPACIPLLIFWMKPEVKQHFGRQP